MSPLKAVDLFCGLGGASIGLDRAGVDVVGAVDVDDAAIETYRNNPIDLRPFQADLRNVDFLRISNHYAFSMNDIDLLIGCPPCQNFSTLRDTKPWPADKPKDELLLTFYQHIRELRPQFVIFENVPGIARKENGRYLEWFKKRMRELGYGVNIDLLNAADFGVPQRRLRTVGIFARGIDDDNINQPTPTHREIDSNENGKCPYRTVADAISRLPKLEAGDIWEEDQAHRARNHQQSTLEIIKAIPEDGGSRTDIDDEELILDCHKRLENPSSAGNIYGRMAWDDLAPTLTTRCTSPSSGRFVHPEQHRGISFREAARLMGLPDFSLPSYNSEAERVIGNAVPPPLIEAVIRDSIYPLT